MRYVFLILFVFLCGDIFSQGTPVGVPTVNAPAGWARYRWLQSDSGQILAVRDTNWLPRFPTAVIWPRPGIDTAIWVFPGARPWKRLGMGSDLPINLATANLTATGDWSHNWTGKILTIDSISELTLLSYLPLNTPYSRSNIIGTNNGGTTIVSAVIDNSMSGIAKKLSIINLGISEVREGITLQTTDSTGNAVQMFLTKNDTPRVEINSFTYLRNRLAVDILSSGLSTDSTVVWNPSTKQFRKGVPLSSILTIYNGDGSIPVDRTVSFGNTGSLSLNNMTFFSALSGNGPGSQFSSIISGTNGNDIRTVSPLNSRGIVSTATGKVILDAQFSGANSAATIIVDTANRLTVLGLLNTSDNDDSVWVQGIDGVVKLRAQSSISAAVFGRQGIYKNGDSLLLGTPVSLNTNQFSETRKINTAANSLYIFGNNVSNNTNYLLKFDDTLSSTGGSLRKNWIQFRSLDKTDKFSGTSFNFSQGTVNIAPGAITNEIFEYGWNLSGDRITTLPGIGTRIERSFDPDFDSTNAWQEWHEIWLDSTNFEYRLSSYTINPLLVDIDKYFTISRFYLKQPSTIKTGAVYNTYFSVGQDQMNLIGNQPSWIIQDTADANDYTNFQQNGQDIDISTYRHFTFTNRIGGVREVRLQNMSLAITGGVANIENDVNFGSQSLYRANTTIANAPLLEFLRNNVSVVKITGQNRTIINKSGDDLIGMLQVNGKITIDTLAQGDGTDSMVVWDVTNHDLQKIAPLGSGSSFIGTTGSVIFVGTNTFSQNNSNFFWDNSNIRLGIGTATPTSKLDLTTNGLGVSQTATSGLLLNNSTAATAGAQQISPAVRWSGSGWKTNATAASQTVEFRSYILPIQGAANPSTALIFESQVNGAGWMEKARISSDAGIMVGLASPFTSSTSLGFSIGDNNRGLWSAGSNILNSRGGTTFTYTNSTGYSINTNSVIDVPDRIFHVQDNTAATTTTSYSKFTQTTSGTSGNGFGVGHEFELENASGTNRIAGSLDFFYTDAVNATEDASLNINLIRGGTLTNAVGIASTGNVTIAGLTGIGTRTVVASSAGLLSAPANGTDGQIWTLVAGSPAWANAASVTTLYNGDGSLTGTRQLSGAGNSLNLGIVASKLNNFAIVTSADINLNADDQIKLTGGVAFIPVVATDADYTVTTAATQIFLPSITADRTFTLPSNSSGQTYIVFNDNSSANSWNIGAAPLLDGAGNALVKLNNKTTYVISNIFNGTTGSWKITASYGPEQSITSSAGTLTLNIFSDDYEFTGTTTTWTLPSSSTFSGTKRFYIKNMGSGDITLNRGGSDNIYDTGSVTSVTITPGSARMIFWTGTIWSLQ